MKSRRYTDEHAKAGVNAKLPELEVFENQYPDYEITITLPEYTAICPKTKLPDFGIVTIKYAPAKYCAELKSLKEYILAYRNLGIFYENAVNKILADFVKRVKPKWAVVRGEFSPRGGIRSDVEARYGKTHTRT
ncbi:MAG: preQ(1) synthase [Candidatus Firestonebacteria bacterium]